MNTLHTTTVTENQIDHLGHMNVMFYGAHAGTGATVLLDELGIRSASTVAADTSAIIERDRYTRHHREQLLGAQLEVHGGVVDSTQDGIRLYEELLNAETGEVAATFVLSYAGDVADPDIAPTIEVPEHGRARSLSLDHEPTTDPPSLELLRERDIAIRQVRTVTVAEAGTAGGASIDLVADLVWAGVPLEGRGYQEFHEGPEGTRIGWATMETRATWARRPSAGDRVQSFAAEVDIAHKTVQSHHWVYDVDRGDLVCAFSTVSLAFDPVRRRSVEIPDHVRRAFGVRHHTDLA